MTSESLITTRYHYASALVKLDHRAYNQESTFKPRGLWYSVGSGWEDWCKAEGFALDRLAIRHAVAVNGSNILRLGTRPDVHVFAETYGTDRYGIDWQRVAAEFDGIEAAPYFHDLRFGQSLLWYYGWDCPSGCLWNLARVTLDDFNL